jgi:protein-tyrosine phosphatase
MDELLHPDRYLDLDGAVNVRDLGGYATQDGRSTRWGIFFRSGTMHALPQVSQDALAGRGLQTIIDLRTTRELESHPNVFSDSSRIRYVHLNMIGDEPLESSFITETSGERADRTLASYGTIIDRRQTCVGRILALLAEESSGPAAFHCAGGKDRTGITAALLLGLAGVSADVIAEDYALSARYLIDVHLAEEHESKAARDVATWQDYQREFCPAEGMRKVLTYLDNAYGGIEEYVRRIGLGDDQIASLRAALVE